MVNNGQNGGIVLGVEEVSDKIWQYETMGAEELAGVVIAQQVTGEMIWSCCRLDIAGQMLLCRFGVMATRSVRIPVGEML